MKYLIFLLFFVQTTFAAYIPIKEKTPLEFQHIIAILQSTALYSAHKQEIDSLIPEIDRALSRLNNDDVDLIIKSEIYKTLLIDPPSSRRPFHSLSPKMVTDLLQLSKKIHSPFFSWLAFSIHLDMKSLIYSPLFPSFKDNIKSSQGQWSGQMALMKKKFALLLPWYDYLTTTKEERLTEKIYPLLLKCLRQIRFKSTRYASLLPRHPPGSGNELKYFEKVLPNKPKNSIDSLLKPIVEANKKTDLPVPVDDWVPKKDDYTQKLPLPTNDWLPEPVDDWKL